MTAGLAVAVAAAAGAVGLREAGRVTGMVVLKGTKIGRLVGTDAASFFCFVFVWLSLTLLCTDSIGLLRIICVVDL